MRRKTQQAQQEAYDEDEDMRMTDMELDECEETTLHDVNIEEEMRRKTQIGLELNYPLIRHHRRYARIIIYFNHINEL